jgi:hypothetical protein
MDLNSIIALAASYESQVGKLAASHDKDKLLKQATIAQELANKCARVARELYTKYTEGIKF